MGEYALFYAQDRLYNTALGSGLYFTASAMRSPLIFMDDMFIHILQGGIYYISLMLQLPPSAAVDTTLNFQLNNSFVPGGSLRITKASGAQESYAVQAIARVGSASTLRVSSQRVISVSDTGRTLATLAIFKISDIA